MQPKNIISTAVDYLLCLLGSHQAWIHVSKTQFFPSVYCLLANWRLGPAVTQFFSSLTSPPFESRHIISTALLKASGHSEEMKRKIHVLYKSVVVEEIRHGKCINPFCIAIARYLSLGYYEEVDAQWWSFKDLCLVMTFLLAQGSTGQRRGTTNVSFLVFFFLESHQFSFVKSLL